MDVIISYMSQYVELQHLVRTFNWHSPSWDLFVILFWLVAAVLYAVAAGRGRLLSVLVSVYMAKLLVVEAPFLQSLVNSKLNIVTASLQTLATFAAIFLILFYFLSKYGFRTSAEGRGGANLLFGLPFALLQMGLLINIVISFLPQAVQQGLHPLIVFIFLQSGAGFVWLLAPVAYLIIFGRFVSHRSDN